MKLIFYIIWLKILTLKSDLHSAYIDWKIKRLVAQREWYRAELIRMGYARWIQEKEKDVA